MTPIKVITRKVIVLIVSVPLLCHGVNAQNKTLDIAPVFQETPEWCWVSCGEMVFKYYGVCCINPGGDYQCGIIALLGPQCNMNCQNCPVPAGSTQTIINMLTQYPMAARNICGGSKTAVHGVDQFGSVSFNDVKNDIDNDMPLLAGVNPGSAVVYGFESAHATIIVGYEVDDDNMDYLIVNDPFPYSAYPAIPDPYSLKGGELLQAGQYKIEYGRFKNGFAWNRTLRSLH
jgi:Peptidase_C39 like family